MVLIHGLVKVVRYGLVVRCAKGVPMDEPFKFEFGGFEPQVAVGKSVDDGFGTGCSPVDNENSE